VTVLDHPPYPSHLAPADYFLFPKVKSHLKGRLFDSISDIQKAVTSALTLSLLMSYICIYIYMELLVKPEIERRIYMDETFYWGFASLTVHFVNICVKNQQIHQLFIQFINDVW
jgi:hypothetical protein